MGGSQPFPLFRDVGGLLGGLRFLDSADKLGPVIPGILRDGPEHIGNQGQNSFGLDTVLCRAKGADRVFPILAASVLRDALAVVCAVNIHLAAAIGAVHQAGQRMGLPKAVRVASGVSPDTLHIVKGFLVDNGLMGVLKDQSLTFRIMDDLFALVGLLPRLEIDRVLQVLPPAVHDIRYGGRCRDSSLWLPPTLPACPPRE